MSAIQQYPESDSTSGGLNGSVVGYLSAILYGGKCLLLNEAPFDDTAEIQLPSIPDGAKAALVIIEADATEADAARVARFRQDGANPTAAIGMPVGDNGSFEIKGSANLAAFRIIGITAGKTHKLTVEYYGAG